MSACNPELVSAYLDGELEKAILEKVTDHLLRCEKCKQMLTLLAQVRDSLTERFAVRDPEAMTGAVMAAISNEKVSYGRTPTPASTPLLSRPIVRYLALSGVAAASIALWFNWQSGKTGDDVGRGEKVRSTNSGSGEFATNRDLSGFGGR